jgi:hypothetical protein
MAVSPVDKPKRQIKSRAVNRWMSQQAENKALAEITHFAAYLSMSSGNATRVTVVTMAVTNMQLIAVRTYYRRSPQNLDISELIIA